MTKKINLNSILDALDVKQQNYGTSTGSKWTNSNEIINSFSPVDGKKIGSVSVTTKEEFEQVINTASSAFKTWRLMPAPQRGEIVRQFGDR